MAPPVRMVDERVRIILVRSIFERTNSGKRGFTKTASEPSCILISLVYDVVCQSITDPRLVRTETWHRPCK